MVEPQQPHGDEFLHRTRTMALGVVASFAGGALLILGLGGSKVVAAIVFAVGLAAGGVALRHAPRSLTADGEEPPLREAIVAPEPELRSVRRVEVPSTRPAPQPRPAPEPAPEPVPEPVAVVVGSEVEIDLTAAAPAVDAVVQALADLRDEASATEALLERLAARRGGGRATAPASIRGMTRTDAPAPPLP